MSRSYRKNPILKARGYGGKGKKYANRKVRRSKDVPNGKAYKKFYPQYDVVDQWYYLSLNDCIRRWYRYEKQGKLHWWLRNEISLEEEIIWWYKTFYWK